MSQFQFSAGPWNVSEGADSFGPEVRKSIPFAKKVETFKKLGLSAVQFHDDDAVPEIDTLSHAQIMAKAKETSAILKDNGMLAEFVAPRLWFSPKTVDGGFTANSQTNREYALWRAFRSVDIARELGCDMVGLWFAREGTLCPESKDAVLGINRTLDAINQILDYDKSIRIFIEPKPNEPTDRSFCPTMGHAMALSEASLDPGRVGGMMESAHAVLAGLDPAIEISFALRFGRLFGVHLNDQNGLRYDQDKTFGAENLRSAFNQVKTLVEHQFGSKGEYIGLDVKAMRTQPDEKCYKHLENSIRVVQMLEEKARKFDYAFRDACVAERDYESLEMYVLELLMNG
jgi:xylose isomerase